jgi:hypothetical protein
MKVERRKYRFRVLNAAISRGFRLRLIAALGRREHRWATNLVLLCGGLLWALRVTGALG